MVKKKVKKALKILMKPKVAKLNPNAMGLALGLLCAVSMVIFSLWVIFVGKGQEFVALTASFYLGYSTTIPGMFLGMFYGFIDGFIGGYVFAWLYNKFS